MEKVIKDGEVAILVSHGFGAGWFSWNPEHIELLYHPLLIEMVENGKKDEITEEWVKEHLGINVYCGGAEGLRVHYIPQGTLFRINEYEGAESIETYYIDSYMIA